jgi:hypothetical protein
MNRNDNEGLKNAVTNIEIRWENVQFLTEICGTHTIMLTEGCLKVY